MTPTSDTTALPVDVATIRETVNRLLDPDAAPQTLPPASEELQTLTATLRGHLQLLAPEVEHAATRLKPGSVHRYTVLGCVWEAHSRLQAEPNSRYGGLVGHARRLARVLNALCDHYEQLGTGGETREHAALRRLGDHSTRCSICRALDDQGANANLPCAEGERIYDEWRQARRGTAVDVPREGDR